MPKKNPDFWTPFYDILTESITQYIIQQISAGAEVIQLFDSWVGVLQGADIDVFCTHPIKKIIKKVKTVAPHIPIIVFPKNIHMDIDIFQQKTDCNAISLSTLSMVSNSTQTYPVHSTQTYPVQGCLCPQILKSGENLEQHVFDICNALKHRPHIFNLSHGIDKQTPIAHVHRLIEAVKRYT